MVRTRRPRSLVATLAAVIALLTVMVMPASAITNGELDHGGHPHVGLMVAVNQNTGDAWRCSGTLISPTVYLTAGHCTFGATSVRIWFNAYEADIRANGYPFAGGDVTGTAHTHPDYNDAAFFLRDVGVVILDQPVYRNTYGVLPGLNQLDALATQRGRQTTWFTAVGYGLQYINPVFIQQDLNRRVAYPKLNQINVPGFTGDFSMLLSNNAKTGGTCYGDSGGPIFLGDSDVIAAVASYGITDCTGVGGVFRMDRSWSLNFVNGFLNGG
jgi:hypothetical protein